MSRFLLPCKCGEDSTIEVGQAGQTITCQKCGEPLDVPTMREIRKLQPAEAESLYDEKSTWSDLQGTLFAAGLMITLIGLALSVYFLVQRLQVQTSKPGLPDYSVVNSRLDQAPVDVVLDVWTYEIEQIGLGGRIPPAYLENRAKARIWEIFLVLGLVAVATGVGCVLGAFRVKPKTG